MDRAELIDAVWRDIRLFMKTDEIVEKTIDIAEPLIRADERERILTEDQALGSMVRKDERMLVLADLRAKVEAKRDRAEAAYRAGDDYYEGATDAYADVLDLIDRSSE